MDGIYDDLSRAYFIYTTVDIPQPYRGLLITPHCPGISTLRLIIISYLWTTVEVAASSE